MKLPTYVAYTGVKPDLPGTAQGVDPAFRNFPDDRPKSVPETPGKGETLTGMANIYYAVPPGPDQNTYWAGLNKRMDVDLQAPDGQQRRLHAEVRHHDRRQRAPRHA